MGFLMYIPIFFVFGMSMILYADAFETKDGILVYHKYVESFEYPDPNEWRYLLTFTELSDIKHPIILKIPNTYPLLENVDFGQNWGVVSTIQNDFSYDTVSEYSGECYCTHVILPPFEYDALETSASSVATGSWVPTLHPVPSFCQDIFENPPSYKDCLLDGENHINRRGDAVCVDSDNLDKLFERGYLV